MNKYHIEIDGRTATKNGKKVGCIAIDFLEAESYFAKKGFAPKKANTEIVCDGPAKIIDWAPALAS